MFYYTKAMLRRKLPKILAKIRNFLCVLLLFMIVFIYVRKRVQENEVFRKIPKSALKYVQFNVRHDSKPVQTNKIQSFITKFNTEQRVLNMDVLGPLKPRAPVFVIFVDKFKINLKYLLVSLSTLLGIEDALIIFSHSSFDENVNNLLKTIDFALVLQIFYPYSMEIYPNEFPGYQRGDCPPHIDMDTARSINCTGADSPDIHGRYRDPLQAQTKHYWWWTMNKIFENLAVSKDHAGIFTFLDDDVFLLEDFIYMTVQMMKISRLVTVCEFTTLQEPPLFQFSFNYNDMSTYEVELSTWDPKDYTSVLSFHSSVWSSIEANYLLFCNVDDASWARSLYFLSLNRKDGGRFKVLSSKVPRAFKTSSSALIEPYVDFKIILTIYEILSFQEQIKTNLYPSYLEIYLNVELDEDEYVIFDNSGGWNDPRDKNMCLNITSNKIKKVLMDMNHEFHEYDLSGSQ